MFCKECGAKIEDGKFCTECGTAVNSSENTILKIENEKKKYNRKLKTWESIVLLILIPFAFYWLGGPILGTIGFILSIIYLLYNDHQSKGG